MRLDHELQEAGARHKAAQADVETREAEIERLRKRCSLEMARCAYEHCECQEKEVR